MSAPYPQQAQPVPQQTQPIPGQVPPAYDPQYAPPPPPPGAQMSNTTVVVSQPGAIVVAGQQQFSSHDPVTTTCTTCQAVVQTRVDHETGLITWAAAAGICLVGCDLGCCLIPFCVNQLKDARHSCPNCNTHLGTYKVIK
ncbi:lipopolysaccharide-induced tumor necrosis factor-alpha factor homolog [Branchiostoma floridae x Branchiostoma belcheri]